MTEWIRLGAAVGALVVAVVCVLAAATIDQDRLRSNCRGRSGFLMAAALLIVCIPLLALDAGGAAGPVGPVGLAPALVGAVAFTGAGRRSAIRTGRRWTAGAGVGLYPQMDRPMVTEPALLGGMASHAVSARVPVLLVSVAGDRHWIELNQN
jgi:hypothetical protein